MNEAHLSYLPIECAVNKFLSRAYYPKYNSSSAFLCDSRKSIYMQFTLLKMQFWGGKSCDSIVFRQTRIYLVVLTLSLILTTDGQPSDVSANNRIVGGSVTNIQDAPYIVSLYRRGQFICGGSLVADNCVLTAAHCVQNTPADQLQIQAGTDNLSANGVVQQVARVLVPSFFTTDNYDMDVAVLKLSSPISGANISTIPIGKSEPVADQTVEVLGWGKTAENGMLSQKLLSAKVKVISRRTCAKQYVAVTPITDAMFCASVPGEKDACEGDSGGPAVCNNELCGVVSFGIGCARPEYAGVYASLASLRARLFLNPTLLLHCGKLQKWFGGWL